MRRESAPTQSGENPIFAKLLGTVLAQFGITPTTAVSPRDYERMTDLPEDIALFQLKNVCSVLVNLLQKDPALLDHGTRNQSESNVLAILIYLKHVSAFTNFNAVGLTSSLVGYREDGIIKIASQESASQHLNVITLEELQNKVQALSTQAN